MHYGAVSPRRHRRDHRPPRRVPDHPRPIQAPEAEVRRPCRHAGSGYRRERRPASRLQAQAEQLRPWRRYRTERCAQPHPLRTPRSAHRGRHQRQGQGVLLGRQYLHARRQQPCVEGQLRPLVCRQPAGSAAAGRAAGHRRPDPCDRQAPCAPRPGRYLLHHHRRRARPARQGLAAGRRYRQAGGVRAEGAGARAGAGRAERPPGRCAGRRARADRAHHRSRCAALYACDRGNRPRRPHRYLHGDGADGHAAAEHR
ncbi:hypothetical protein FQZ97_529090 [compost metagenome]